MRVLVIPEDFTRDQYILKPLVEAMLKHLNRPRVKVTICRDPQLGGIAQATNWEQIEEILERYMMYDLFLLCVDRDGKAGRRDKLDELEQLAQARLPQKSAFFAENAWQEIEVWVLAGHDLPAEWQWQTIRQELDPKELYFLPLAQSKGLPTNELELVYKTLTKEATPRYSSRIRKLCPEDIASLENKIANWMGNP